MYTYTANTSHTRTTSSICGIPSFAAFCPSSRAGAARERSGFLRARSPSFCAPIYIVRSYIVPSLINYANVRVWRLCVCVFVHVLHIWVNTCVYRSNTCERVCAFWSYAAGCCTLGGCLLISASVRQPEVNFRTDRNLAPLCALVRAMVGPCLHTSWTTQYMSACPYLCMCAENVL